MKSKTAQSMSLPVVMGMVLLVIVLLVILYQFFKVAKAGDDNIFSCESFKGVWIEGVGCNETVSSKVLIESKKAENTCCKKKFGVSNAEYKKWLAYAPIVSAKGIASSSTPLPTSGAQPQVDITTDMFSSDKKISLKLDSKFYGEEPIVIETNQQFLISALHKHEKGKYCHIYVVEAEKTAFGWQEKLQRDNSFAVVSGLSQKSSNCKPVFEGKTMVSVAKMHIDNKINKPGYYKAIFSIKEKFTGLAIASDYLIFEVKKPTRYNLDASRTTVPTIAITMTQSSRQKKIFCGVEIHVEDYGEPLSEPYQVFVAQTTKNCLEVDHHLFNSEDPQPIMPLDTFCLEVQQPFLNVDEVPMLKIKQASYSYEDCDEIVIIPAERSFTQCTQSCESYSDTKAGMAECNDYTQRAQECQFSLNCFEDSTLFKRLFLKPTTNIATKCVTCDSTIRSCAGYRTAETCLENNCLRSERCDWDIDQKSCVSFSREVEQDLNT